MGSGLDSFSSKNSHQSLKIEVPPLIFVKLIFVKLRNGNIEQFGKEFLERIRVELNLILVDSF